MPRPLGSYAVEWEPTEWRDDVLGRLGGAFRGTVMEFKPGREFFVADAYWLPPDGDPIGPMALEAPARHTATAQSSMSASQAGRTAARWSRYYEVLATGFTLALERLKTHVERRWNE